MLLLFFPATTKEIFRLPFFQCLGDKFYQCTAILASFSGKDLVPNAYLHSFAENFIIVIIKQSS